MTTQLPPWWKVTEHAHSEGRRFWITPVVYNDAEYLDPPSVVIMREGIGLRGNWGVMPSADQSEFEQVWAAARLLWLDLLTEGA